MRNSSAEGQTPYCKRDNFYSLGNKQEFNKTQKRLTLKLFTGALSALRQPHLSLSAATWLPHSWSSRLLPQIIFNHTYLYQLVVFRQGEIFIIKSAEKISVIITAL